MENNLNQYCQPFERPRKIEHTVFSKNFFDEIYPSLTSETSSSINEEIWCFRRQQYELEILPFVQSTQITLLQILGSSDSDKPSLKILALISRTSFTHLKILHLSQIKFSSIQGLAFLQIENIETISLNKNELTSVKGLNKTNWPNFEDLNISENNLNFMDLSRTRMKKQFNFLILDEDRKIQVQDMSSLIKLEPIYIDLTQLSLNDQQFIFSMRVAGKLIQKFNKKPVLSRKNFRLLNDQTYRYIDY